MKKMKKLDFSSLIGLTEKEAFDKATEMGYFCVYSKKDGIVYMNTMDLNFNRLKFAIKGDKITDITNG